MGAGAACVVLALGFALGACSQSNTPDEYNDITEQSFLETCTNYYFNSTDDDLTITENTVKENVTAPNEDVCRCMYSVYTGPNGDGTEGGMPINETAAKAVGWTGPNFTDFNADLKSDPQGAWDGLPADPFKDGIAACEQSGGRSSSATTTTAGDGTTTTTAATDETTTTTAG